MNSLNPIASYLRHLIVVGVVLLLAKLKFPMDGASAFADAFSLSLLGSVTWAIVKYAPNLAKGIGLMGLIACFQACTPAQIAAAQAVPIHATAKTNKGTMGYDSATGVSLNIDATSGK
ncbi:MAG: hypothetical protein WCH43_13470 [Verrucomicrobiota bacterium]